MEFTSQQLKAIGHTVGNLQLIACAGSGKTEVVARRVANLLKNGQSDGLTPASIVAFTFTDKAAAELKERIVTRCREELGATTGLAEMFVGTIHAFCLDLLQTEVPEYRKYSVLNGIQQQLFVDRYSSASGLTRCSALNGAPLRRYQDTRHYISALSILREANLDTEQLAAVSVLEGLDQYENLLKEHSYLDYSAILAKATQVIGNDLELQQRLSSRIQHVIVDEYQDVNPIQERIVQQLRDLGAQICVVGDDDQTIYQWRGSDVTNIISFSTRYPKVAQVNLEENFRSSPGIVETARDFISQNKERLPKAMVPTDVQLYETGDIIALKRKSPEEEAAFIASTIQQLIGVAFEEADGERGLSYSDCAILLRSVRSNADPIVEALKAAEIPAIIVGMNRLFDTPEAQASRLLFYFLVDQEGTDEKALRKAWRDANVGAKPRALNAAIEQLRGVKEQLNDSDQQRWGLYSLQRSFLQFLEVLELREEMVPSNGDNAKRGEIVFYNLGKFSQLITDFEQIHSKSRPLAKYQDFANFLTYRAEEAYPEGWQDNQYANPDAVRIMTVHQAKGMQWPAVFIPALLRNRFPGARVGGRNVWHLIPREGVIGQERYEGGIEDERRLFYVAMTRSQKFLFMTWAPIPGLNNRYINPSDFWNDVLSSKWVKRRPADYSGRRRLMPEPKAGVSNVVFSFSNVKHFFECPYQFKLRVLYGFNAPVAEAIGYGKSLHDALAEVHTRSIRGDVPGESEVPQLVETHLFLPLAYPALRETLKESAQRVVLNYLTKNKDLLTQIEFAEKSIELNLGDGVSVVGRIDVVRRLDTNEVTIVDLKTSERAQEEELTEDQLHIYALGYEELTGTRADFVEIYELEEQRRKVRTVDDDFIADVRGKVKSAANELRQGNLKPVPSQLACGNCDFRRLCPEGSGARRTRK